MFERWKYTQVNDNGLPLDFGRTYSMDLVGCDFSNGEASPAFYGWVNGVRVFVDGKRGIGYCAGDNVNAVVRGYSDRSAFAEVAGVNACFLREYAEAGRSVHVWKCQTSRRDLRDVAGTLKFGKSDSGIFTIVPSTKHDNNDFFEGFDASIEEVKRDKNGRYLVIGNPTNPERRRDKANEIFVAEWPAWKDNKPNFGTISAKNGIPSQDFEGFFYVCRSGEKYIVTRNGWRAIPKPGGYELTESDAMRYYISGASGRPGNMKMALFEDGPGMDAVERTKSIMKPIAKDFHVEEISALTLM
jgi:hypothetical protein